MTYRLSVRDVTDGVPDDYSADTETTGSAGVGEGVTGKIESDGDQDWFAVELEAGRMYRIYADALTLQSTHIAGIYDSQGNALPDTEGVWTRSGIDQSFFRPSENGTYYVAVEAGSDDIQGRYRLHIDAVEDDYGTDADTAGAITVGSPASGRVDYWEDEDWFAVELEAGMTYQLDLEGAATTGAGDLRDPYLRGVYDPQWKLYRGYGARRYRHPVQSQQPDAVQPERERHPLRLGGGLAERDGQLPALGQRRPGRPFREPGDGRDGAGRGIGKRPDRVRGRRGLVPGVPQGRTDVPGRRPRGGGTVIRVRRRCAIRRSSGSTTRTGPSSPAPSTTTAARAGTAG